MNLHFLSFIADVISWGIVGYYIGLFANKALHIQKKQKNFYLSKVIFAALFGGLHATVIHSLPETGLSMYHFLFAISYASWYVIFSLLMENKRYVKRAYKALRIYSKMVVKEVELLSHSH